MERAGFGRPAAAVAVVVLVVLSGCAGGVGSDADPLGAAGNSTNATTAAGASTSPASADAVADEDLPPGVTSDGISNATALARTSHRGLVESGYVAGFRLQSQVQMGGRTRNLTLAQREVVEPGAARYLFQVQRRTGGAGSRMDAWSNGSTSLLRQERGGNVSYRSIDGERLRGQFGAGQLVTQYVGAGDYELTSVNRTANGTFLTLRATEYVRRPTAQMPAPENVTSFRGIAVVDRQGRLRYLDVRMAYAGPNDGSAVLRIRFRVRELGAVRVDRPAWVGEALSSGQ